MRRWLLLGAVVVVAAGSTVAAADPARLTVLGGASLAGVSAPAGASTVAERWSTSVAEADTTLDRSAPAAALGAAGTLTISATPPRDALLRIDLTGAAGSYRTVLRLHPAVPLAAATAVPLDIAWLSATAWDETSTTAASAPAVDGTPRRVQGVVGDDGWLEIDLTGVVGGGHVATLLLRAAGRDLVVDARESASPPAVTARTGVPAAASTVRVWAVGDLACPGAEAPTADECRQWAVSNLVAADPTAGAFLALGDLQYPRGAYADYLTGYAPSYGRLLGITLPTPGNHDYGTAGAAGYHAYFGDVARAGAGGWYSVDLGDSWHVVVLDSNCDAVGCGAGSAQERWLRADLAASTRPCTIGVWHHPRFSSGAHYGVEDDVRPLWQALADDRAEVILNGHDHVYERFHRQTVDGVVDPTGIRQFTVGTGGRDLYAFGTPLPSSSVRVRAFGALRLDLGTSGYTWAFVDETGTVLDSGTGTCA